VKIGLVLKTSLFETIKKHEKMSQKSYVFDVMKTVSPRRLIIILVTDHSFFDRRNRHDIRYIGVDFHPHQQTVSFCNTESGECRQTALAPNPELVRRFYQQFSNAVVGIEAGCTALWFEQLLLELGHELKVGNPNLIRARARSRHKSDKRDADLKPSL
jgi:hypothetical protein